MRYCIIYEVYKLVRINKIFIKLKHNNIKCKNLFIGFNI